MNDSERCLSQPVKISVEDDGVAVTTQIAPAESLPSRQYRWNTSEEIYSILLAVSHHKEWLTHETQSLPANGSMILYDKRVVGMAYRRDGYVWKTRKDGKNTREDHMKLRVKGANVISGHYVHSAILSSFHRRSYCLTARPNIVLVHYLNAPVEGRDAPLPSLKNCDKRVWSKEELAQQIYPMYDAPNDLAVRKCLNFVPPSPAQIDSMIDDLLTSQTNENGVQVTAQWVLSLDNNCSYVVHATQPQKPNTFQIPNSNVQFVLGHIDSGPVLQRVSPPQTPARGVTNHGSPVLQQQYACDNVSSSPSAPPSYTTASTTNQLMEQNSSTFSSTPNKLILPKPSTNSQQCNALGTVTQPYQTDTKAIIESQPSYLLPATIVPNNATFTTDTTNTSLLQTTTGGTSTLIHSGVVSLHSPTNMESCQHSAADHDHLPDLDQLNVLPMEISSSLPQTDLRTADIESSDSAGFSAHLDIYDMSTDEINSALSANMPNSCSPSNAGDLAKDLQLDSNFDLFSELNVNEDMGQSVFDSNHISNDILSSGGKVTLTALAPEWSYADGGSKVLLVGPWRAGAETYSCIFGDKSVEAELVQDGVLSCITPAHRQGIVQVKVAYSGEIISERCNFEFRDRKSESSRYRSWFLCEESRLQMALIDRLEMIKCRLDILFPAPILADNMNLEQRVNALVYNIQRYKWRTTEPLPKTSYKGLTLFHLAAALGYRILLDTLMNWRNEYPCDILTNEVSTRAQDSNGCTPMHWACALGRMETTLVMYYMDRLALDEINKEGMTPLSLARAFRNKHIVEMLVQQENTVLESKLDHQGLNKCIQSLSSPSKHSLRRSASPARRSSPVRHPPITRHNSTPNSNYLPPHLSLPPTPTLNVDTGIHCSTADRLHTPPPHFHSADHVKINLDTQSDLDEEESIVDVEGVSDDGNSSVIENEGEMGEIHNHRIRTLAEHIIAAIPDRIKSTASDDSSSVALLSYRERSSSRSSYSSTPSCAEDSGVCTPLTSDWMEEWNRSRLSSSSCFSAESIYRPPATAAQSHPNSFYSSTPYFHSGTASASPGLATPYHSTSAASTTSYNTGRSDSPPPSAQILGEYFNAGEGVEYGLSQLTLSDTEQRKLYQAAQVIQHAFRQFKDKKQQQREIEAAVIIQTYYRRFKEFTTLRHLQKQQAATLIQSQFRSYYAQKRFKKSRDAALLIQHHYRAYKEHEHFKRSRNAAVLIQQKFRTHYNRKKCSKQPPQDGSSSREVGIRSMHLYPSSIPHK